MRVEEGRFPNGQMVAGSVIDNAYRQQSGAVVADWTLTGHSHVSVRAGWINRDYEQLLQRDFNGRTYRVAYDWTPTGKFLLTAIALREISPYEQVNTSFVLVKGIALRPTLRLTEKIGISGNLEYNDREYLGDPRLLLGAEPPTERVRVAAVTASYRPLRPVTLEMNLRRESRSSTIAFGDYVVDIVSVSARLAF
jgi:hypothetical protein